MKKNIKKIPKYWSGTVSAGNELVKGMIGVDSNSTEGVMMDSTATGAEIGGSIVPGWGHLIGAGAGFLTGAFKKGSVDPNTGEIQYGGIFGRSKRSLRNESNRIKTSLVDKIITQDLNEGYYSDPNNSINTNIYATAAEGGIMRQPVDALVSKGELIYNPMTKKLSKVPGSKGKPNKADDVYARLYEGDVVISNSPTMLMSNGKTPAQNLEGLVDKYATGGTVKAREAIIKKVVNWQEANKTKPQEYAKFDEGTHYVDGQRAIYRHGRWWWNEGGKKDAQGKMYFVPYTGKSTPSETEPTKHTSETPVAPLDPAYRQHVRYSSTNDVERKATVSKPSSDKKTIVALQDTTPLQINQTQLDWARQEAAKTMSQYAPSTTRLIAPGLVAPKIDPTETVEEAPLPGSSTKGSQESTGTGFDDSNWRDSLYRMAVLSQPLWDRAKAEPVNYESPVYKYVPTAIDVLPYFRDINQNYASSIYDIMNNYRNSGAGISATMQAANDRAKQLADIRQYQTNAQNELIAKNVGIYNNWANEHARIMNDVYDKNAANRATARNINRQNIAAALSNYGQILRDDKLLATESQNNKLKTKILEPFVKAVYENSDELIPMITQYGTNKNIKKKQINR